MEWKWKSLLGKPGGLPGVGEGSELRERPVWQRQRASLPMAITAKVGKRWALEGFSALGIGNVMTSNSRFLLQARATAGTGWTPEISHETPREAPAQLEGINRIL